ncbi:MAG: PDZ domain-containing protein [Candidatus Cyclonatronum sp.]|uniref:S41 family peptidase n=1 Tax=Cyclonatronum sp. TaxID=3024185 RepID=UPI0025C0B057|nr:S41 family peptidase [Cyclonatronum sp.]MCC5932934.1 PDZ domain-containing protein [Balneolales bacterium]MCH8486965.1 PDZ domain-containing protein [Cyclonatronum sp.]
MIKRFFASGLTGIVLLSALWLFGFDKVFVSNETNHEHNLQKYIQTQRWILNNYVDEVEANILFKDSIRGMVRNIGDSTFAVSGTPIDTTFSNIQVNDIRESAVRFERAYTFINQNFPDLDMSEMTEHALRGMFTSLDPYTDYIDPRQSDRVRENFAGRFQGIGVQFDIIADSITVISAISGGPSDVLGIRSGDRIISIDDENAVGFSQEDVLSTLRGPKGSVVRVGIVRPGSRNILHFNITRDDIPLFTVDTSYMLDERTGYIKINRFAQTTYDEFMEAMAGLNELGMERLILDLRNNPGGFLDQAVRITSEFFPRNTKLVSTRSRHARFSQEYRTRTNGRFQDIPLMVMINEGSASGSEIVAGAIQDNDRGLIVGRRTFGKGLVQQQYELVDQSFIRVTISRYFTPSGRLIQKPFNQGREEYALEIHTRDRDASTDVANFISNLPDSLVYETFAGRTVFGGGGIVPDHIIQADTTRSYVLGFMRQNNIGFEFVRGFLDEHYDDFRAEWGDDFEHFRADFSWSPEQMDDFWTRMSDAGLVLSDTTATTHIEGDTMFINPALVEQDRWIPPAATKAELARQVWSPSEYFPVFNDLFDTTLHRSMELWEEVDHLKALVRRLSESSRQEG